VTGVTLYSTELAGKRLELLKEIVPRLARVAVLAERDHPPTATLIGETQVAAQALRLDLQIFEVRPEGIADAFKSISKARADAIIVQQTASFNVQMRQIANLAISYHLPTVHETRTFGELASQISISRPASSLLLRITLGSASISPTRKTCCAFAEPTAAKIVAAKNDMSLESLIMIAPPLYLGFQHERRSSI
jgi:hypothetical protein